MTSYLEQVRRLANKSEEPGHATDQYAINEKDEISPTPSDCRACMCDDYIIRLHLSCPTCEGSVCAQCSQCLKASHVWRRAQRETLPFDMPLLDMLGRLQRGRTEQLDPTTWTTKERRWSERRPRGWTQRPRR